MSRFCSGFGGVVLAFTLAGCGDSEPDDSPAAKAASAESIKKLRDTMAENAKNKTGMTKPVEKPAEKAAEKKAGDAAPTDKK